MSPSSAQTQSLRSPADEHVAEARLSVTRRQQKTSLHTSGIQDYDQSENPFRMSDGGLGTFAGSYK